MAVGLCEGVGGGGCSLFFHVHPGSHDTVGLIEALKQLRVFLGGQKATVLGDGLPAHPSTAMAAFVASQRNWLVVERLPGDAPELNPAEQRWANLKGQRAGQPRLRGAGWVISAAWRGIARVRGPWHLPSAFGRHAGLSAA